MSKLLGLVIFALSACYADFALAAEAQAGTVTDALPFLQSWPEFGKVLACVLALQVFLRGLAEGLTSISDYTDNTWDNKAAAVLSETSWFLGTLLGKIGYGQPTLVTRAIVEQKTAEKEVAEIIGRGP